MYSCTVQDLRGQDLRQTRYIKTVGHDLLSATNHALASPPPTSPDRSVRTHHNPRLR